LYFILYTFYVFIANSSFSIKIFYKFINYPIKSVVSGYNLAWSVQRLAYRCG